MEGENYENEQRTFYYYYFLGLSLFETTDFVWGVPRLTIFTRKIIFHAGKDREKWHCSLWKIFLLRHWLCGNYYLQISWNCRVIAWNLIVCHKIAFMKWLKVKNIWLRGVYLYKISLQNNSFYCQHITSALWLNHYLYRTNTVRKLFTRERSNDFCRFDFVSLTKMIILFDSLGRNWSS